MPALHDWQTLFQLRLVLLLQWVHRCFSLIVVASLRHLLQCLLKTKPQRMASRHRKLVSLRRYSASALYSQLLVFLHINFKMFFEIIGKLLNFMLKSFNGLDTDAHLRVGDFMLKQAVNFRQKLVVYSLQILHHVVNSPQSTAQLRLIVLRLSFSLNNKKHTIAFMRSSSCVSATRCCSIKAPSAL